MCGARWRQDVAAGLTLTALVLIDLLLPLAAFSHYLLDQARLLGVGNVGARLNFLNPGTFVLLRISVLIGVWFHFLESLS